jgi:pyruvate carboxylase
MSDFFKTWDATNQQQMGDFSPLPENTYMAVITAGEWKRTKAGDGEYLQLTLEIINDPQYAGRKLWARLNLKNRNTDAVRIAMQEMSSICHAIGVLAPSGIPAMCNIPMQITVKCSKRKDTGEITNEIKGYASKARPVAAQPRPAAPVAATPQPVTQNEPAPW